MTRRRERYSAAPVEGRLILSYTSPVVPLEDLARQLGIESIDHLVEFIRIGMREIYDSLPDDDNRKSEGVKSASFDEFPPFVVAGLGLATLLTKQPTAA